MSTLRSTVGLFRAGHLEPGAAVTVGATMLAAITGRDAWGIVAVAAAVAASQLTTGWHNDWLDADRDAAAGRRDKPIPTAAVNRRAVGLAAAVGAAATVVLGFLSGPAAGAVAAIGLGSSLAYNRFLKFTAVSVLAYMVSFACLPAFVVLGLPGTPPVPWWLLAAGATLGAGAHFANVLPDFDADARTGVRGLPHQIGRPASIVAAAGLLTIASGLLVLGPPGRPGALASTGMAAVVAILVAGGVMQARTVTSHAAFRSVIAAALIDVALLLAAGSFV